MDYFDCESAILPQFLLFLIDRTESAPLLSLYLAVLDREYIFSKQTCHIITITIYIELLNQLNSYNTLIAIRNGYSLSSFVAPKQPSPPQSSSFYKEIQVTRTTLCESQLLGRLTLIYSSGPRKKTYHKTNRSKRSKYNTIFLFIRSY